MARLRVTVAQETGDESQMNEDSGNPYKIVGNKVMHEKGGKWSVKQTCKNPANAKAAVRLLHGIEGGMKPR